MNADDAPRPAQERPEPEFSLGKLVAVALGAAVLVLGVATAIVAVVAPHSALAALIIALVAVVVMIAVIAWTSKRMLRDVQQRIDELRSQS